MLFFFCLVLGRLHRYHSSHGLSPWNLALFLIRDRIFRVLACTTPPRHATPRPRLAIVLGWENILSLVLVDDTSLRDATHESMMSKIAKETIQDETLP